uniref:G-protein coupled receptors family 1 profile domain-containing protein n=1 Tax=Castor canadensis TaxID=51338 RepID=A0A8C0ZNF7_CASCN
MTHALSSTLPTPRSMASSSGMDAATLAYLGVCSLVVTTCVCGIVGNGLVVWLLSCRAHRSPFHVYVLNLAVADLLFLLCMAALVGLETQPLAELNRDSHEVEVIKAYEVLSRTKYFAYTAGLSLLTAISTQRCVSVLFPIWYKCHQPRHLSAVVCAVLWALSLLMNTLASFFCSWFWNPQKQQCFKVDMVFGVLIIGVFVPVMTLSSAILYVRVRRSSLLQRQRPRRLFVVILVSVLVFLVCSLPLGLYWFVLYWVGLPREVWLLYTSLSRLSSSIGSSANPVIYFLVGSQRSRGLQESLGAVLGRALREEPELEGRETPSTTEILHVSGTTDI